MHRRSLSVFIADGLSILTLLLVRLVCILSLAVLVVLVVLYSVLCSCPGGLVVRSTVHSVPELLPPWPWYRSPGVLNNSVLALRLILRLAGGFDDVWK